MERSAGLTENGEYCALEGYRVSFEQKSAQPTRDDIKTYADVMMSPVLSTRLLITSGNGTIFGALLWLSGIDKTLANGLSTIISINYSGCYWLVYLFILGSVLTINLIFLFLEVRDCLSESNDWHRVKSFIFQERPNYNFSVGKKEMTKTPLYILVCFGSLIIFSLLSSIDMMILTPLEMHIIKGHSEYVFKYSSGVLYGTYIISYILPYLLLLMKILSSRVILSFNKWIR
jgi:hypothetical protein